MPSNEIIESLKNAAYDLKFLLNRGYRKKVALNLVTNKYLLDKNGRNYLVRKVFSDKESRARTAKIVDINNINNKTIFIDGYNVLISVETICKQEYDSLILCDDGILRDVKAVFGKYKSTSSTETALNYIINVLAPYKPACIYFLYDSPVSKSGELASHTDDLIKTNGLNGAALTHNNVDFELVKLSKDYGGIVATSDSAVIDKVDKVLDIPHWICNILK
ncbi:MAG: DUF434 domain-containing protein [Methanobacterium sp.]